MGLNIKEITKIGLKSVFAAVVVGGLALGTTTLHDKSERHEKDFDVTPEIADRIEARIDQTVAAHFACLALGLTAAVLSSGVKLYDKQPIVQVNRQAFPDPFVG